MARFGVGVSFSGGYGGSHFGGGFSYNSGGHNHYNHCAPVYRPHNYYHHNPYNYGHHRHHGTEVNIGINVGGGYGGSCFGGPVYPNYCYNRPYYGTTCHYGWGVARPVAIGHVANFQEQSEIKDVAEQIKDIRKGKLDHFDIIDPLNPADKITIRRGENHGHLTLTKGDGETVIIDKNVGDAVKELARLAVNLQKAAGSKMNNEQLSAMYVNGVSSIAYSHTHDHKNDAVVFGNSLRGQQGEFLAQQKQQIEAKAAEANALAENAKKEQAKLAEIKAADQKETAEKQAKEAAKEKDIRARAEAISQNKTKIEKLPSDGSYLRLTRNPVKNDDAILIGKDKLGDVALKVGNAVVTLTELESDKLPALITEYNAAKNGEGADKKKAYNDFVGKLADLTKDNDNGNAFKAELSKQKDVHLVSATAPADAAAPAAGSETKIAEAAKNLNANGSWLSAAIEAVTAPVVNTFNGLSNTASKTVAAK